MKSFAAISLLALISASLATTPTRTLRFAKRSLPDGSCGADPGSAAVVNAINSWNTDVVAVNAFLEQAGSLDSGTLAVQIVSVMSSAQDEPNQLKVLACVQGITGQAQDAVNDLAANFNNKVITPLGAIMQNSGDQGTVATQLGIINQFRCCNVLPDLDKIWAQAAEVEGVFNIGVAPTAPPRPTTCTGISC